MGEKSVAVKLGIKSGERVVALRAPAGFVDMLGALPAGASLDGDAAGVAAVVILFSHTRDEVLTGLPDAVALMAAAGRLWVAYAKGGSAAKASGINRDSLRDLLARQGLETISLIAVDATWSALRVKRV